MTWKIQAGQDSDVVNYIASVETADGQSLESGVKLVYHNFIIGCKADGIWDAIKASCILAGARTLAGALVPLKGTAPTNYNFVSGDYNRKTGLKSDSSTKYLDSNRLDNADPQNDSHRSVYVHTPGTQALYDAYIGVVYTSPTRQSYIMRATDSGGRMIVTERGGYIGGQTDVAGQQNASGFIGQSRESVSSHSARISQNTYSLTATSTSVLAANSFVFARNFGGSVNSITNARLSFYSIGESLDLALLDSRVTTLMSDIEAAIP